MSGVLQGGERPTHIERAAPGALRWHGICAAVVVLFLGTLQLVATIEGFDGPLPSIWNDFIGTPKSMAVPWGGLALAMVGLTTSLRIRALVAAIAIDVIGALLRIESGGSFAVGNGAVIVLAGLAVYTVWRRDLTGVRSVCLGGLLILATKAGDTWLQITTIVRPYVLDEYAQLADHALGNPAWIAGNALDALGPVPYAVLHWVYIQLPIAAIAIAIYQLRNVTSDANEPVHSAGSTPAISGHSAGSTPALSGHSAGSTPALSGHSAGSTPGWPSHYLVRTFLLIGLVGPVFYILFPVVGPVFAFGTDGDGFQVANMWPTIVPFDASPTPIGFDAETPRNCMPSLHTAWALSLFIHSRRGPWWLRVGGTTWLLCTLAATLGFGYHYGVDLVAGVVLCLTLESILRDPERGWDRARIRLVVYGSAVMLVLLLSYRYLALPFATYPELFGPAILVLMGTVVGMFYATFFAVPGTALATWGGQTGRLGSGRVDDAAAPTNRG